jgi:hypothetical protein
MDELPLRIVQQPGGATIRCLCGLELARMRKGVSGGVKFARAAGGNRALMSLAADVTTPGLAAMVAHAMACQRGKALLAAMQAAWSG